MILSNSWKAHLCPRDKSCDKDIRLVLRLSALRCICRSTKVCLALGTLFLWWVWVGDASGSDLHAGHSIAPETGRRVEEDQVVTLEAGQPIEGTLARGDRRTFEISLDRHKYLQVTVEPQDLDLTLSISLPNGSLALRKLSPYGSQEVVDACLVAGVEGNYKLIVESTVKNGKNGRYKILVSIVREATVFDEIRAKAESHIAEAQQLGEEATAESRMEAIRRYEEALPLLRRVSDRSAEAQTLDSLGSLHNVMGSNKRAIELLHQSLSLFQSLKDRRGEATAWNDIGSVENDLGDNKTALIHLNQALSIRKEIGDRRAEAETLEYVCDVYENTSDTDRALKNCNEALALRKDIGDLPGEAESLKDIGILYHDIDEEHTAIDFYGKALPIQQDLHDLWGEGLTLSSIGASYDTLGEKRKAVEYFTRSLSVKAAAGNKRGEAHTLGNLCSTEYTLGEWQNAFDHCRSSIQTSREVGDRQEEAASLTKLGLVYTSLGEPEKALKQFRRSLLLSHATNWPQWEATNRHNIGQVFHDLKDYERALANYSLALPIRRKVRDRSGEAATLCAMGRSYEAQGNKALALDYFDRALALSRAAAIQQWEASSLSGLGSLYANSQEHERALKDFSQALSIYQNVGDQKGIASAFYGMARVERDLGEWATALDHIESALKILETLRTKIANQQFRTSYFSSVRDYYEFYIELLMQLEKADPSKGYAARAFEESERSRARTLLETIQEAGVDVHQGVDAAVLDRERSVQQRLEGKSQLQMRLAVDPNQARQLATVRKEIDELQTEFQSIEAEIRKDSPAYAELTQLRPITSTEIQNQALDSDTVLLEYFLGDQNSYLWVVTTDSMWSYRLPARHEIEQVARRVYRLLSLKRLRPGSEDHQARIDRLKQSDSESSDATLRLSNMILGPAAKPIGGKRLVIVADGALQFVPFEALPAPKDREQVARKTLVTDHEIVVLPSASVLAVSRVTRSERRSASKTVAVLADPVFDPADSRVKNGKHPIADQTGPESGRPSESRSTDSPLRESRLTRSIGEVAFRDGTAHLLRLPYSRQEAKSILGMVSDAEALAALDFRASRPTALSPELSQYRIIHFATHGLLDSEHPELSGLVLSLVDERGKAVSGFLDLQDIYNLHLPSELVVLSSCETALGKEVRGEGLIGMTRGFMYAGADRVVASLWKVDDAATSELMERFYRGILQEGLRPVAALRQAQIQMSQQRRWADPYYWAAFTIQGEWR